MPCLPYMRVGILYLLLYSLLLYSYGGGTTILQSKIQLSSVWSRFNSISPCRRRRKIRATPGARRCERADGYRHSAHATASARAPRQNVRRTGNGRGAWRLARQHAASNQCLPLGHSLYEASGGSAVRPSCQQRRPPARLLAAAGGTRPLNRCDAFSLPHIPTSSYSHRVAVFHVVLRGMAGAHSFLSHACSQR